MKFMTRIISVLLAFLLAVGVLPINVLAAEEDGLLVKRVLRVYSSVDQQRHEVQVTEKDGKIYINATDLTALLQGQVYLWQKKTGFYNFIEKDNEFIKLLYQGINAAGISTEAPYYYILQNGITKQNLRYNLTTGEWTYFATESKGIAGEICDMPELAPPIVENDVVFVELLPFSKALGVIVNIAANGDGISFHVPQVTMDYLVGIISEVFDLDTGVIIPWRDDENLGEAFVSETALYLDQVFDICSGELIPFITGNYDANRFEEAMIAVLSVYGEETADYLSSLWSGMEYTRSVIDTPAGLMMLAEMDNGYIEYLSSLESDAKLKDLMQTDSPGISGMESATGLLLNIYNRQIRLSDMVTTNVEAANNVFNGDTCWVSEESLSLTGKTTGDIVRTLVDEYYHGISEETIKKTVLETTVEVILGQYAEAGPETLSSDVIKHLPIYELLLDVSSFGLNKALTALNLSGIALQAYEAFSGYQYGTLHQVAAYREFQDILYYGIINCLNSSPVDVDTQAQYIFDCAKLAFLAKLAYSSYMGQKTSEMCEKLFSVNPQEVALSTAESIEALSGATDDEIRSLIFDNVSYKFDFWDFADAMGMDPYRADGTVGIGNSIIADLDSDGYPEYLMSITDKVLYPTPFYVVLDADVGIVAISTNFNEYGLEAITLPIYNPETGHILLRTSVSTQWETSEYYQNWTGEYFASFAREYRYVNNSKTEYSIGYENVSEYKFKNIIEPYSSTPYTGYTGEVGSDHLKNVAEMIKSIRKAVPAVKKEAVVDRIDSGQVFKVDGIDFNQDRSIISVSCSWATTWEAKQTQEPWWDPYACYYVDAESGEVLRVIVPEIILAPEDEEWLSSHGFGY